MLFLFLIICLSLPQVVFCSQAANNSGVLIKFQINGYSNPDSLLPNGNACECPANITCWPGGHSFHCIFGFLFVLATDDGDVHYEETEFSPLDINGSLREKLKEKWNRNYAVQLSTKPSSLAIVATHKDDVYSRNGKYQFYHGVVQADRFVVPLLDVLPTTPGVQAITYDQTHKGMLIGTSLNLSYSIACLGQLIGSSCDLNCTRSQIDTNVAQCISVKTGYTSICQYTHDGQVDQCEQCLCGTRNGTYCRAENEWEMMTWVFMGISVMLAGLWIFTMFYRPATNEKKRVIDNPNFELFSFY